MSTNPGGQPPENGATGSPSARNGGLVQPFIGFLDRNLSRFSRGTRDVIGIGVLVLLAVVVLHGFVAPTYIEGRLIVEDKNEDGTYQAAMGKRYFIVRGNENTQTNDNARWMLPVRGLIPQPHVIQVRDDSNSKDLGEFVVWAPWPVFSAFHASEYKVVVRLSEPNESKRVQVSRLNVPQTFFRLTEQALGVGVVHAQGTVKPPFVLVHLQGLGDIACTDGDWCGTKGESRRLEGFMIRLPPGMRDVGIEYMCHLEGQGDQPWVPGGKFCGTRGESRRLEGFAIKLTGPAASQFRVKYKAHLQGKGDTRFFEDGHFAGTRGDGRRVEALLVQLERR